MDYSKNFRKFPIAIALCLSSIAFANPQSTQTDINAFLNEFNKNPKKVMDTIPQKKSSSNEVIPESQFSNNDQKTKEYLSKKDKIREKLMKNAYKNTRRFTPFAEYLGNDNPKYLVENPASFIDNINTIDSKNVSTFRLSFQPWSGSYWPLSQGSVTNRYAERLGAVSDINAYANYILNQRPASSLIREGKTNNLSPAEKYDLLVNDQNYSLTQSILGEVTSYGSFEGWEGICHGWAPAAYMYNRPARSVKLTNTNGVEITFYPSDIKALSSLLWANLSYPTKFIGGRCNQKDPQTDANGRILSQECFDTNPGTFHLTLINQMGLNNRSFVFDATYDFQVWNQPILGYSYVYFNPQTGRVAYNAKDAAIPMQQFTNDKFRKYRSNRAAKVVGVKTRIEYIAETGPSTAQRDNESRDNVISVEYYYDLELDSSDRIIGGEWYQNAHPDFIWTPTVTADVSTGLVPGNTTESYNYNIYKWQENPTRPFNEWGAYSPYAAQRKVPLENIIRSLVAWSADDRGGEAPENCKQPCIPNTYKWHRY
ncbi:hypothetical protein ACWNT8_12445 [Pigmentibacter ruber]|uniref:hypothetical protein n=1 Tax=Pigmentibacter ruber TaxID=2683196 RepID=UPI00131D4F96|nr:hypothetical protein [Pigmentibacter ruber]BFD31888.1 hypothetical protein GTC16762_15060 [Pigmentibacter ruber]